MLYIVHVDIESSHAATWWDWMRRTHIPDVLETGCFREVTATRDPTQDSETHQRWSILYAAHDAEAFERYEQDFAASLRDDHVELWGDVTRASRQLLPIEARFFADMG